MAESLHEGKTLKELEKEITCSVCQEHYTEPKVLPCLHYYCKGCLLKLTKRTASNKPFSCPECRKKTTLPKGGVEELKTAFFINRLKSNFSALERVQGNIKIKCEGCKSKSKSVAFCRQCAVFICHGCVISHKKLNVFSSHEVVSLEDLKQGRAKKIAVAEPATKKCTIHEEPLLIYCFDCDSLICLYCTVIEHREHKFQFSKVASPETKRKLLEELVPFKSLTAKLAKAVDVIHTTKLEIQTQGDSVVNSIESSFQQLSRILKKRKDELVQEALSKVKEKVENLTAQEKELSLANAEIQSIVEYTERFVGCCSDNEVLSMHTDIRNQIHREIKEHSKSESSLEPVEEADMGVEVRCAGALKELCQVEAKITRNSVEGEEVEIEEGYQKSSVTLMVETLTNNEITSRSVVVGGGFNTLYNKSVVRSYTDQSIPGEYRIQYTPTVRGRHQLTLSVVGQQIAGTTFPVLVTFSPTPLGKPFKVWHGIDSPHGIAIDSKNNVIATEFRLRELVKIHAKGRKSVLVECSKIKLVELECVAVDEDDNIYCTDYVSNMILKCDKNGGNVQVFVVQQVAGPGHRGVAVVGDEVMLCERNNKSTIMVYDREFHYVRRIQHDSNNEFIDIAADIFGNLYVTDFNNECIQVFSNSGYILRSFECDSGDTERLFGPYYICVSGQYVLEIMSLHLASTDLARGDFSYPRGVCVDSDGYILVADCGNNRIQCF